MTCSDATNPPTFTLQGRIDQDYTLAADRTWILQGNVFVGEGDVLIDDTDELAAIQAAGVTLTVEEGTHVQAFTQSTLIVTRGSQLIADGTRDNPITFSSVDDGFDGLQEWGGVLIQGFASQFGVPISDTEPNPCFGTGTICNVQGEGGDFVGFFGGNIDSDNSGIIRYVRIAEAGLAAGTGNELNGLTLQGVGYGTEVEYVHVHNNLDDGVEWFGGTVNAKYIVLTGIDDDDIDFDEGFRGNIQYAIVVKDQNATSVTGDNDPRAIELNSSDDDYVPQTQGAIANVTIIGGPVNNAAGNEQPGMRLRGSVDVDIVNTAVNGFDDGCIRIDDSDVNGDDVIDALDGANRFSMVDLTNILTDCAGGIYTDRAADNETNVVDLQFFIDSAFALFNPEATVAEVDPVEVVVNGSGFEFDNTNYVGAVAPGTDPETAWWYGWTIPGALDDAIANNAPPALTVVETIEAESGTGQGNVDTTGVEVDVNYVFNIFEAGDVLTLPAATANADAITMLYGAENGCTSGCTLSVFLNGVDTGLDFSIPATGSWVTFVDETSPLRLDIAIGDVISLEWQDGDVAANIDLFNLHAFVATKQ